MNPRSTRVLETVSRESTLNKVSPHSGEETWPTSSDISLLKLLTSPAKITTSNIFAPTSHPMEWNSSLVTALPVVLPELPLFASSTLLILPVPDSPLILVQEPTENTPDLLTASKRPPLQMVLLASTEDSESQLSVLLDIVHLTSVCSIPVKLLCSLTPRRLTFLSSGLSPKSSPSQPVSSPTPSTPSEEDWWCNLVSPKPKEDTQEPAIVSRKLLLKKDPPLSSRDVYLTLLEELVVLSFLSSTTDSKTWWTER